jgi:hypothetical protein
MKKLLLLVSCVAIAIAMGGCTGIQTPVGYGMASPAGIYTNMIFPSALQENSLESKDIEILRPANGESQTVNVLGIAATGDGGLNKAVEDALHNVKDADDLINMKVDTRVFSILGLFTTSTTKVKGLAVKYKSMKN